MRPRKRIALLRGVKTIDYGPQLEQHGLTVSSLICDRCRLRRYGRI